VKTDKNLLQREMPDKNEKMMGGYALFFESLGAALSFADTFFAAAALLSFFDVVITSFYRFLWYVPHSLVLLIPGYTLCSRAGNPGVLCADFCNRDADSTPGKISPFQSEPIGG
jgi:hypothetical protein